ncbi:class IIb bacteriocin, lactobin A/cerein 7B family [Massilia sp. SYSU DXS3249]
MRKIRKKKNKRVLIKRLKGIKMNALDSVAQNHNFQFYELNDYEVENISGGFPPLVAAAAAIAVGNAALDFGHKLGGMLYRALH